MLAVGNMRAALILAAGLSAALSQPARPDPAGLCMQAAQAAARTHGVPLDVMRRIALLETGRTRDGQLRPWPWALNIGGDGHWLTSRRAARDRARAARAQGRRNIDLGCFQINYRWHGQNFASLDAMLDPARNADYAARFLHDNYVRLGDWLAAVGAYHSRTPVHARRYKARYAALALPPEPAAPVGSQRPAPAVRPNGYALLTANGAPGARGSLVPRGALAGGPGLLARGTGAP